MNRAKQNVDCRIDDSSVAVGSVSSFGGVSQFGWPRYPSVSIRVRPVQVGSYNEYLDELARLQREGIRNS